MKQIISSLLDNDAYKFSMGQAIFHQYPYAWVTWTFHCRNKDVHFTKEMVEEIREQIHAYCTLEFKKDELDYLSKIKWIKKDYVNILSLYHPQFDQYTIDANDPCGLRIELTGPWFLTSPCETPTLAIVNEVYYKMQYPGKEDELYAAMMQNTDQKIADLNSEKYHIGFFSEFGMRRRLSAKAEFDMIKKFAEAAKAGKLDGSKFVGTSDVLFAKELGLTPVGTMAHEYIMAIGQGYPEFNPAYSNKRMLESWVQEYGTQNGIALTDTIGTPAFLCDFTEKYAHLFSGVRHDSGDPYAWGEQIIKHYKSLGFTDDYIKTKTLLFSDSLDFERATKIYDYFKDRTKVAFGIGTWLSNDCGKEPLNIVMKLTRVNDHPVAKLSDNLGKTICTDTAYIDYLQRAIAWRLGHEE